MHIYEPPPRLTAMVRGMPVELDALLAKMLHKSVDERVPSAAWALAALERVSLPPMPPLQLVVHDRGQFAVSLPSAPPLREGMPRWIPIAVLVVAVVIALVAIFAIGATGRSLK